VFSLCFHSRNMYFSYNSHVYQNTHVPYILHEMHSFASVFMGFHTVFTAGTCTFGTFQMYTKTPMYTKTHMYYIFYIKCTILLLFSCVFTAETCTFRTIHMYTKIHLNHIFYIKCTVLLVFSLCYHRRNMYFFFTFYSYIPKYTCNIYST
jgi:hypothetical protein